MNPLYRAAYGAQRRERARAAPYSRTAILARWGYACGYCGAAARALDHVQPLAAGGPDCEANLIPACDACNASKGTKTLAEWSENT